jgi:hypothetical protein
MKWAECIRMNGRWTKSQRLTRFLTVLCNAFATLYAVAASEFDFTDEPYDLIIRLSSQKLTKSVMTRTEQTPSTPDTIGRIGNECTNKLLMVTR